MKVLARIELLATDDGGREKPLIGSFRLNHSFEPGEFVIAQVEQLPGAALAPGQGADLVVDFLPGTAPPALASGMTWRMFDGPKHLVGHGTVLEILDS
jgi:hypothetical protein